MKSFLFPIFVRQGKSRARTKVGYIDERGKIQIEPTFDDGTQFYDGLAAVATRGRWGVISLSGDFLIEPILPNYCHFHEEFASLSTNKGKWGVIDSSGTFVIQPTYDYIGPFKEGLALFRVGEYQKARYGFPTTPGQRLSIRLFTGHSISLKVSLRLRLELFGDI